MFTTRRTLTAIAFAAAIGVAGHLTAQADGGAGCTVFVGGADSSKKGNPELVIFNTVDASHSLDLQILDGDGNTLVDRADEIALTRYQTATIDLNEQLERDLERREKRYSGPISVVISGGGPGFGPNTVLIHVAQYYGKRSNPKTAFVLPAVFRDDTPLD